MKPRITVDGLHAWRCTTPGHRTSYVAATPRAAYIRWLKAYQPRMQSLRIWRAVMLRRLGVVV